MKKLIITASLLSLFICLLSKCKKDDGPTPFIPPEGSVQTVESFQVAGRERSYIQYLPDGWDTETNMPVLLVLHGGTLGTPDNMLQTADFRTMADEEKFILIYPAGIEKNWNDGRPTDANELGIDDVDFFDTLITKISTDFDVDEKAIFATGVSNGGFMSSRLACELSNRIAAIAVVAASIEQNTIFPNCNPANPVSVIYIQGTEDTFVPFEGGEMTKGDGGFIVSHSDAINKWVGINNISDTPTITNLPDITDDGTTIVETKYTATNGKDVIGYVVENGGHTWPQGTGPQFPILSGITSLDMNANEVIWEFFENHKKN